MVSKRIFVFLLFLEVVIKCYIEANTWQRWGNVCLMNKTPRNSKLAFRKSQSSGRWLNWINQSEGEFTQLVQSTEKWERASQIGFEFFLIGFECAGDFSANRQAQFKAKKQGVLISVLSVPFWEF